jgi:hypothetical protein
MKNLQDAGIDNVLFLIFSAVLRQQKDVFWARSAVYYEAGSSLAKNRHYTNATSVWINTAVLLYGEPDTEPVQHPINARTRCQGQTALMQHPSLSPRRQIDQCISYD